MKGLSPDEISALQSLSAACGKARANEDRQATLPRRLYECGYIARDLETGLISLTKAGERALFQNSCITALRALADDIDMEDMPAVEAWLKSNGFAIASTAHGVRKAAITVRGRLWLDSLIDAKPAVLTEITAKEFERRRTT
jgi:hypothetical protein